MNFPGRLIAAVLAVILILLFPLPYIAKISEDNMDSYIADCTEQLSDDIRNNGYLDRATYEAYMQTLDASGELYDLEIEDIHPVTGEELAVYDDMGDIAHARANEAADRNQELITRTISFKSNELRISDNSSLLPVSNNSIPRPARSMSQQTGYEEIQSFAAHSHTEDCYAGHRHSDSCNQAELYIDMQYQVDSNGTKTTSFFIYCLDCHYNFGCISKVIDDPYYVDRISIRDNVKNIVDTFYYESYNPDPYYNISYKYDLFYNAFYPYMRFSSQGSYGSAHVTRYYGRVPGSAYTSEMLFGIDVSRCLLCGKTAYHSCGLTQDENPICSQVVISITPTNPIQSIKKGEAVITTAIATYLDGHTGIVNCTSNFNPNIAGTQTVTLTYTGLVGDAKTHGTLTCTISVSLTLRNLSYITATPATQSISRLGTPSFTVTAYYNDGSSEVIPSRSYSMSAFDNTTPGTKTITISYTEGGITKTTTVTVYIDDITSLTVTPNEITVDKYTEVGSLPITVTANYYYGSNKVLFGGYIISGFNSSVIGHQTVTISYSEGGKTVSANITVHVTVLHKICSQCGNRYELTTDDIDPGCPFCKNLISGIEVVPTEVEVSRGMELPITVRAIYRDGTIRDVTGWNSSYEANKLGFQLVTIRYGDFEAYLNVMVKETEVVCPNCGKSYPVTEESCPICREKVESITVAPTAITVEQYGPIELEVTATYADGSTRQVTDWSIDCTTARPGIYQATVTYHNKSAKITLTVLSPYMETCPYCNKLYDRGEHPEGCPDCFRTVIGIEAYSATGSNLVQIGGTPNINVVLLFKDTHREITRDGYTVEGFQPWVLGVQTVTIRYKEFSCNLILEMVNTLNTIVCPKGHIYYPDEDGNDPGCPFCIIERENKIVYYYDITYLAEILEVIYTEGVYYFEKGNYLTVRATKRDISLVSKIQKMFFKLTLLGRKRRFTFGGEVL
jgi:Zn finger protein HypA/HybF involved in hydrogenase expression